MSSQSVSEFMSREICEEKITKNKFVSIVAYPQNNVIELAKIMVELGVDSMPVLSSPWNKKPIGSIKLNRIRNLINQES